VFDDDALAAFGRFHFVRFTGMLCIVSFLLGKALFADCAARSILPKSCFIWLSSWVRGALL